MLNRIRRLLFQSSHLAPYIPIIKEQPQQKVFRLINDKSDPFRQFKQNDHSANHQQFNFFEKLFLGNLPVLNPIRFYMLFWYALVQTAILYNYVEFGIVLYYEGAWEGELNTPLALFFGIFMILVLVADMGVQLNTGFLKRGMIIMDRQRVFRHYIRNYALWDSIYIAILVLCLATGSLYLNYGKFLWVFKLIRMSQIDDFFLRSFNIHRGRKTLYVIFKLIVIILILSHLVGVIFYVMDYQFLQSGYYEPSCTYLYIPITLVCWLISSTSYSPIIELSWEWQYMYTMYWGINTITTISYGDIAPLNPIETVYVTAAMCFGFVVYGYVVNQIVKIILWARGHKDKLRSDMVVMDVYMESLKVPSHIKDQVRNHLEFLHNEEKNRDIDLEQRMRAKLPDDLRYQLVASAYAQMNVCVVNIFESRVATKFLFNLEEKMFTFDENICSQGERANYLHFLHRGLTNFNIKCGKTQFSIYESQTENEFLGQYQFFTKKRLPFSIISKMASTVYSVSRESLFEHVNSIQELREKYKEVEYEVVFKKNLRRIYHSCYFCKEDHLWRECPEKFPHFRKVLHTQNTKSNSNIRVIRRKYHTLNDKKELEVLKSLRQISNKKLVNTIEKRLARIKEKITERNEQMEIDVAKDWNHFDVTENLSRKKEIWNERVYRKLNPRVSQISLRGSRATS